MKTIILTIAALCYFGSTSGQEIQKPAKAKTESTATITEEDKVKVKEDIRKRREQNKIEMEKARKAVKDRISNDTMKR